MNEAPALLQAHGFAHVPGTLETLLSAYTRPYSNAWQTSAVVRWRTASVDVALKDLDPVSGSVGTIHRFSSAAALARDLPRALAHLEWLAANPDQMKCPGCGVRWVEVKDGRYGPFLSCTGMVIAGRKPNRGPICRGISKAIPAVVAYG